jgi:hypothetical protein
MKASNVDEELLEKVQSIMSWPATEEDTSKPAGSSRMRWSAA